MSDFPSFMILFGSLVLLFWLLPGAYICIRWGTAGISMLWRVRKVLDTMVSEELSDTILSREKDVDFLKGKS